MQLHRRRPEDRRREAGSRGGTGALGQSDSKAPLPPAPGTAASKAQARAREKKEAKKQAVSETDSQASMDSGFPGLDAVLQSEVRWALNINLQGMM